MHCEPSLLESNVLLRCGKQYLPGPKPSLLDSTGILRLGEQYLPGPNPSLCQALIPHCMQYILNSILQRGEQSLPGLTSSISRRSASECGAAATLLGAVNMAQAARSVPVFISVSPTGALPAACAA